MYADQECRGLRSRSLPRPPATDHRGERRNRRKSSGAERGSKVFRDSRPWRSGQPDNCASPTEVVETRCATDSTNSPLSDRTTRLKVDRGTSFWSARRRSPWGSMRGIPDQRQEGNCRCTRTPVYRLARNHPESCDGVRPVAPATRACTFFQSATPVFGEGGYSARCDTL
jgi:hypothetical protein